MMKSSICTLFQGHYHFGVAALINSLVAAGYEGTVWAGHRGPLPDWIAAAPGFDPASGALQVDRAIRLQTVALDPPLSLTYYKATFMLDILERLAPETGALCYMDPDMVAKCAWREIEEWLAPHAVALVEDLNGDMPAGHPKRLRWTAFFAGHGETPVRPLERYYNAGFVGIGRDEIDLLRAWQRICAIVAAHSGDAGTQRRVGGPDHLFHSADEDALNFALTLAGTRLETFGPEAMDLVPGGAHLSHAVGPVKPWQGHHLRRAWRGDFPNVACESFYRFADGPLLPFSRARLAQRRMSVTLALAWHRTACRWTAWRTRLTPARRADPASPAAARRSLR